jgi:[ribosomal protein S5]-alanine N-acetyltransferase
MFDFGVFPILETPRMVLREMTLGDIDAVLRIRGDYEVTKYNTGKPITTRREAEIIIDSIVSDYRQQLSLRWAMALKTNNRMIGMCGFNYWDHISFKASVGYDLARDYWGQGYMPEALRHILHFGFAEMQLNRIEADCTSLNTASVRVLEKVGFQHEGVQRDQYFEGGQFYDLMLFSLLKREWQG